MDEDLRFTHNAAMKLGLRDLLFRSKVRPAWVFSDQAAAVLQDLWSNVAGALKESEVRKPEGLDVMGTQEVERYFVRVVQFPPPENRGDNYFGAVAYRPGRKRFLLPKAVSPSVRYLALEYGLSFPDEKPMTVLGEWSAIGHLNYGGGPEPTPEAFLGAIRLILREERTVEGGYISPRSDSKVSPN